MTNHEVRRVQRMGQQNDRVLEVLCSLAEGGGDPVRYAAIQEEMGRRHGWQYSGGDVLASLASLERQGLVESISSSGCMMATFRPIVRNVSDSSVADKKAKE